MSERFVELFLGALLHARDGVLSERLLQHLSLKLQSSDCEVLGAEARLCDAEFLLCYSS